MSKDLSIIEAGSCEFFARPSVLNKFSADQLTGSLLARTDVVPARWLEAAEEKAANANPPRELDKATIQSARTVMMDLNINGVTTPISLPIGTLMNSKAILGTQAELMTAILPENPNFLYKELSIAANGEATQIPRHFRIIAAVPRVKTINGITTPEYRWSDYNGYDYDTYQAMDKAQKTVYIAHIKTTGNVEGRHPIVDLQLAAVTTV